MPVRPESSVELLLKARSGDDEALNQLLTRYLPRLRRWASGLLPRGLRTMLDTGDLVQEAVIKALPHLNTLEIRTEPALQFYLQRAVRNRIIDVYRRAGRRPTRAELPADVPAHDPSPHEALIGAEALESYERGLAALKDEERQAIMLRIELGLSYKEIATHLGSPSVDAARMTVTRAIVRLADKMGRPRARESRASTAVTP